MIITKDNLKGKTFEELKNWDFDAIDQNMEPSIRIVEKRMFW